MSNPSVPEFDPATHPEGGVPAHAPDPAGVPELHGGQSKHDASEDAPALLPNFPAGHLPAQATPYVPPGQETQSEAALEPAGLQWFVPHCVQTMVVPAGSAAFFHDEAEQPPDASVTQLFIAESHHETPVQSDSTTGQTVEGSSLEVEETQQQSRASLFPGSAGHVELGDESV